ncbi:MAG: hypothetical protein H6Q89_3731 [Myxococcaceae bacterium]|nr:hypothetical protein [Myxococcaceae bacterium]
MDAATLTQRLNNPADGGPLDQLAELTLDALLDSPLMTLVPEDFAVRALRVGIEGWLQSPQAVPALERLVEAAANELQGDGRKLREVMTGELKATVRELLERPYSPDRKLVLTIIDRPPMRELIRGLLLQTVTDFGKKVTSPVAGVAKSLGGLARFAVDTAKARSGAIGSMVGAVSGEVERQLEKRAVEFVDASMSGVFGELADSVSNPKRAHEAAELRAAFFEGVLELTMPQLARELINLDVPGGAKVLRDGLDQWIASPASEEVLEQIAARLTMREGGRSLREVLEESGQLQTYRTIGREALRARLAQVVGAPAFAAWLDGVMKP